MSASVVFAQGTENKNGDAGNSELTQENKGSGQENDQESQQDPVAQKNQPDSSQGDGNGESVQTQNQEQEQEQEQEKINQQNGESNGEIIGEQVRQQTKANNTEQLKEMIENKRQEMQQEIKDMKDKKQQGVYQNQNQVRLAVLSMFAMEDLVGEMGPQIREIARDFNNSVQATIRAEEKVQERNGFMRFLFGGDEVAAGELEQEVNTNRERIQTLNQLREECDCEEPVRTMLQEQIQNIEQEQNRLQQLAQAEKQNKGLFGWLWK